MRSELPRQNRDVPTCHTTIGSQKYQQASCPERPGEKPVPSSFCVPRRVRVLGLLPPFFPHRSQGEIRSNPSYGFSISATRSLVVKFLLLSIGNWLSGWKILITFLFFLKGLDFFLCFPFPILVLRL